MPIVEVYTGNDLRVIEAHILNTQSKSEVIRLPQGMSVVGMLLPAAGGWDAADLALLVSVAAAAVPVGPVKGSGGASYLKCAVTAGVPVAFPFADQVLWPYFQLFSCTAGDPSSVVAVPQTADRTIQLILRKLFN